MPRFVFMSIFLKIHDFLSSEVCRKTLRCIAPRLPRRRRGARLDVFYGAPHRHAIFEVNRRYCFCFRPNRVQVNIRVARHVGPVKKSRRLPCSILGEASLYLEDEVLKSGAAGVRALPRYDT